MRITRFALLPLLLLASMCSAPVSADDSCNPTVACSTVCDNSNNTCSCSHTFFRPRPLSQNSVLELGLQQYQLNHPIHDDCPPSVSVQLSGFYYRSTSRSNLAPYFLPKCKCSISIGQNNTSDISSVNLNLLTNILTGAQPFSSTLSLSPRRTVYGGAAKFYIDLGGWMQDLHACLAHMWFSAFVPVVHVKHDIGVCETRPANAGILTEANNFVISDAIRAFNNPAWAFGKIAPCSLSRTGVDDVNLKLGFGWLYEPDYKIDVYGVAFIPCGKKTRSHADFLFEPVLGAGHFGLGAGLNFDFTIWNCDDSYLNILGDIRYGYFFKRKEVRSIDLTNSEWSRYLLVAPVTDPNNPKPGINAMTRNVDVKPRGTVDAWLALHYQHCSFNFELGYDLWWRQREQICLPACSGACPINQFVIFDFNGCRCNTATSTSTATISQGVPNTPGLPALTNAPVSDATITPITDSKFNLDSAATPRALSSTVYGSIGYNIDWFTYGMMMGFGASYEIGHRHAALSQWGVWFKTDISF